MAKGYGKRRRAERSIEGARAAKAGKSPEDCPYEVDSDDFYEKHDARFWIDGFTVGERVLARRGRHRPTSPATEG